MIADERILEYAPSYRLSPLAAELFGGERVWTYSLDLNEVDPRIVATEYHELGECVRTGAAPEVTAEEGRADVALVYAPFEAGRLGRAVTLDEVIDGRADGYLREIDEMLGLRGPRWHRTTRVSGQAFGRRSGTLTLAARMRRALRAGRSARPRAPRGDAASAGG